ncbi:MAG: 50S ribosomal protein L23 [Candidatus Hadarchaeales archaeon]
MKDPQKVIRYPKMSEKAVRMIESENKLVFVVADDANKIDVKRAVEALYQVKVVKVNILRSPKGEKLAYVKLAPEYSAIDLATKLEVI